MFSLQFLTNKKVWHPDIVHISRRPHDALLINSAAIKAQEVFNRLPIFLLHQHLSHVSSPYNVYDKINRNYETSRVPASLSMSHLHESERSDLGNDTPFWLCMAICFPCSGWISCIALAINRNKQYLLLRNRRKDPFNCIQLGTLCRSLRTAKHRFEGCKFWKLKSAVCMVCATVLIYS